MKTNQINYMSAVNIYELPIIAASKVEFLKNDVETLAEFGIDQIVIDRLSQEATELSSLLMDQKYEGLQKEATARKNEIRKQLIALGQYLSVRITVSVDTASIEYSRYHIGGLTELGDSQLHSQAVYAYNIITENEDALSTSGITQADIDKLETLINQFAYAISSVKAAMQSRRIATAKRHEAARNLLRKLSKVCTTARRVFQISDPIYASRYVIYETPATKAQPVADEQPAGELV